MLGKLEKLQDLLREISYLVKIGPDIRSKGNILKIKLGEVPDINKQLQEVIKIIDGKIQISELNDKDIILANNISQQIFSTNFKL